jgi:hypothetical protein
MGEVENEITPKDEADSADSIVFLVPAIWIKPFISIKDDGERAEREKEWSPMAKEAAEKQSLVEKAKNATPEDVAFMKKYADQLSPSTMRAKWIHSPQEHEDRPGQSLATRSPDVIRSWAEERQAVPATVPGTEHGDHLGVLRFNFPGYRGRKLQEVSWDQWMKTFQARNLVFLFQEHKKNGVMSNFFRFDNPTREDA